MLNAKKEIVSRLQKDILLWQGVKAPEADTTAIMSLAAVEAAFPYGVFPTGALHEFLCGGPEQAAACGGFIAGLMGTLMKPGGACLWISLSRRLFPPSLKAFGLEPDRIIFVDVQQGRDVLWATEEALKCEGVAAVVAELREITFAQSRRLQLAVEKSKVTGFLLRNDPLKVGATTCVARWRITPLPSMLEDELPGVGFPRWSVELLKVRNGSPGRWQMEWSEDGFVHLEEETDQITIMHQRRKAG